MSVSERIWITVLGATLGLAACSTRQAIVILVTDSAVVEGPGLDASAQPPIDASVATTDASLDVPVPISDTRDASPDTPADWWDAPEVSSDRPIDRASDPIVDGVTSAIDASGRIGTLFADGFDDGLAANWLAPSSSDGPATDALDGTNHVVTLDSTSNGFSRIRSNLTGDKFTEVDITGSMRFRVLQPSTSTRAVRLDLRQALDTENIFYAVGATINNDGQLTKVGVFKKVSDGAGNYTICQLADGALETPLASSEWQTIALGISGTTSVKLVAYLNGVQTATATDDCTSDLLSTEKADVPNGGCLSAQTGVGIQVERGLIASVDDVEITAP
jgi:hypothetical protein